MPRPRMMPSFRPKQTPPDFMGQRVGVQPPLLQESLHLHIFLKRQVAAMAKSA